MRALNQDAARWKARPIESALLRAFVYLVPLASALGVAIVVGRALSPPESLPEMLAVWAALLALSTATLVVVDRLARRLLPLATLLKLSLAFPDKVPSRMAIARRVGSTRSLQERVDAARAAGRSDQPTRTAEAILELVVALGNHDKRTRGHAERTRVFTDLLADEMGFTAAEKDRLRWASLLHDIGKLDVPPKLLNKPGKPTDSEWEVLQAHPEAGARFIGPLCGWLGDWTRAITEHHERWDGRGYPTGLASNDIHIGARVVAVADSYEVMTAPRPYKRPLSARAARAELTTCAGGQFDPSVVRAFLNISIGRLRTAVGPLSWVAQLPFLPRVATGVNPVGATLSQAVAAGAFATSSAVAGPAVAGPLGLGSMPYTAEAEAAAHSAGVGAGQPLAVDAGASSQPLAAPSTPQVTAVGRSPSPSPDAQPSDREPADVASPATQPPGPNQRDAQDKRKPEAERKPADTGKAADPSKPADQVTPADKGKPEPAPQPQAQSSELTVQQPDASGEQATGVSPRGRADQAGPSSDAASSRDDQDRGVSDRD